jgi:hypothetical protein
MSPFVSNCPECGKPIRRPFLWVTKPNRTGPTDEILCDACGVPLEANEETDGWFATPWVDPEYVDDVYSELSV